MFVFKDKYNFNTLELKIYSWCKLAKKEYEYTFNNISKERRELFWKKACKSRRIKFYGKGE